MARLALITFALVALLGVATVTMTTLHTRQVEGISSAASNPQDNAANKYAPQSSDSLDKSLLQRAFSQSAFCSESHFGPSAPHGRADSPNTTDAGWSYTGTTSAAHWGDLKPEYAVCKEGRKQSPIDIAFAPTRNTAGHTTDGDALLSMHWAPLSSPVSVSNNGHAFQIDVYNNPAGPKNFVTFNGTKYYFVQAHFHGPSEHLIKGRHYPMELHAVHLNTEGRYLVVGILLEFGTNRNLFFDQFVSQIPQQISNVDVHAPLDWAPLLKDVSLDEFYAYDGSFTTPPCTEIVQWIVLKKPVNVARRFIAAHSDHIRFNSRLAMGIFDQIPGNHGGH